MAPSPEGLSRLLLPLLLCWLALSSTAVHGQDSPASPSEGANSSPSSSSFVLADPNIDGPPSAFSPPAQPTAVVPASSQSGVVASSPSDSQTGPANGQQSAPAQANEAGGDTGGYGSLMAAAPQSTDPIGSPMGDSPQQEQVNSQDVRMSDPAASKRHQFSQYAVPAPAIPMPEPAGLVPGIGLAPAGPVPAGGSCPGGASLPIECDPKRPWPQCPPQSYCYATNTVDIGPYFCCPIWSTYGAAWRPATPFYSYAPPPPPNWPEPMRMAAAPAYGGPMAPIRKGRKEQRFDDEGRALMTEEEQRKILQVMNDWVDRQKATDGPAEGAERTAEEVAESNGQTGVAPAEGETARAQ